MKPNLSLTGDQALAMNLIGLSEDIQRKLLTAAVKAGGEVVATRAAETAPGPSDRKHPHLKDSILVRAATKADLDDSGPGSVGVVVGPGKNAFWGYFDEHGTVRQPARPWLRPAFDGSADEALGAVARNVADRWSALEKGGKA